MAGSTNANESDEVERAERFLEAFKEIETHAKNTLGKGHKIATYDVFNDLADQKYPAYSRNRAQLNSFVALRNALSHYGYQDGKPIATPLLKSVLEIERIRDLILKPTSIWQFLAKDRQTVIKLNAQQTIADALEHYKKHHYSQLPVYQSDNYLGLLTTNSVTFWLASKQEEMSPELIASTKVTEVLKFGENHERAVFTAKTTDTEKVAELLETTNPETKHTPAAVIVTETGQQHQSPLGILTHYDLPELYETFE